MTLLLLQYFNHADKSGAHIGDLMGFVVYNNGPLQAGVSGSVRKLSHRPGSPVENFRRSTRGQIAQDSTTAHGTVFTKYNNGRYFFNVEAAWLYWTDRLSGPGIFPGV